MQVDLMVRASVVEIEAAVPVSPVAPATETGAVVVKAFQQAAEIYGGGAARICMRSEGTDTVCWHRVQEIIARL